VRGGGKTGQTYAWGIKKSNGGKMDGPNIYQGNIPN